MAAHSKVFYSGAGDGDKQAAGRNYLRGKESNRPISTTVCKLSPSQTDRITQPYSHSLIARVVGKDIRPQQLADRLHRHLRLTKDVKVFELGLGYFVLKFSETDYLALEDHPWPIPNLCIFAFPWAPNFKPSEATISTVDAWIRLHELSLEYYDEEILRQIGETIGDALVKIDPITKDRKKCKYARICITINLCDPLPSMIRIGGIRQEIEYEGFDLLCPRCRRVVDLKHDCLHIPSGSSRFDSQYRRSHSFQATGPRYQVLGEESKALFLDLNEWPSLSVGGSERTATRTRTRPLQPQLPIENQKEKWGVPVKESARRVEVPRSYPISISSNLEVASTTIEVPVELEQSNLIPSIALHDHPMSISSYPEAAASTTIEAPELEQNNLNLPNDHSMSISSYPKPKAAASTTTTTAPAELEQNSLTLSMDLAPFVVEDHFRATETSSSTTASIPSLQPSPTSRTVLTFCSNGIERSIVKKKITNTPLKGIGINRRPILCTMDPSITSFEIGLSESPDSVPKQNKFAINIVSTSRSENEHGIGSHSNEILGWNFCGIDNANLIEGLTYMVQKYEPSIVVIFGTRISDEVVDEVVEELAFYGSYCKKSDDENRGVWLLMFRQDVQTEVFEVNSYNPQQVSASAYCHLETNEPLPSFSYVDSETSLQTRVPASFCALTHLMANALAY